MSHKDKDNYCRECGTELTDNVSFCPECGAKIDSSDSQPEQSKTDELDNEDSELSPSKIIGDCPVCGEPPGKGSHMDDEITCLSCGSRWEREGLPPKWELIESDKAPEWVGEKHSQSFWNELESGESFEELVESKQKKFDKRLGRLPGLSSVNTTRRNILVGSGYILGGLYILGLLSDNNDNGDFDGTTGFGDGDGVEQVLELTDGPYWEMDISGDGRSLLTGTSEAVRLHNVSGDSREISENGSGQEMLISKDGDSIINTDHGTLTNYNTKGEIQWEKQIEDADETELEITDIDTTQDFRRVALGTEAFVGKVEEGGDVLWEDALSSGRIWEVEVSESQGYVAVRTEDREDNPEHENAVHVYDSDGDLLWSETYDVRPLQVDISDSSEIVTVGLDDLTLLVYNIDGELQWQDTDFGAYFALSTNGDWLLTQNTVNTVVFTPDGDEVWRYEMPDSEAGLWQHDRIDVSNNGRSIASYENIIDDKSTVNVYDERGEVIWQSDYESGDVYVCLSEDGSTWMVNNRGQIEIYHDYNIVD